MELGDYVSLYRKEAGLTIDELASKSGIPKGTINKIIAGTTKSPTLETVQSLAAALGKTINDFVGPPVKKEPPYSSEALKLAEDYDRRMSCWGQKQVRAVADIEVARYQEQQQAIQRAKLQHTEEPSEEIAPEIRFFVPEYQLPLSAGIGEEAGLEQPEDLQLFRQPPRGTSYVARVHGNSMEPTYHDGDRVFVHATTEILPGQIGAFLMDGQQWIKELGDHQLISHNVDFPPIPMRDDIRCQGLVLGLCDPSYFYRPQ